MSMCDVVGSALSAVSYVDSGLSTVVRAAAASFSAARRVAWMYMQESQVPGRCSCSRDPAIARSVSRHAPSGGRRTARRRGDRRERVSLSVRACAVAVTVLSDSALVSHSEAVADCWYVLSMSLSCCRPPL